MATEGNVVYAVEKFLRKLVLGSGRCCCERLQSEIYVRVANSKKVPVSV